MTIQLILSLEPLSIASFTIFLEKSSLDNLSPPICIISSSLTASHTPSEAIIIYKNVSLIL